MTVENGPEQRLTVQLGGEERASLLRRTRRAAVNGLLVAIDAPELSSDPWVVDVIDINASGLGLVLPPELLEGTQVLLSFRLDEHEFSRLPAVVRHKLGTSGGMRFEPWPEHERLKLLAFLVRIYESIA